MLLEVSSRRLNERAKPTEDIWVYWLCDERGEASRIRNISLGGVFLESQKLWGIGSKAQVNFLVHEGQIAAQAVVRHIEPDAGLGLKFIAVRDEDRLHLIDLMRRLRSL